MSDLFQGRILWARLPGPRGVQKKRPAVIVGRTEDTSEDEIIVVGGSTQIKQPILANEVVLPYKTTGRHPITKLKQETIIDCHWIVKITAVDIEDFAGHVPESTLKEILKRLPM